MAKLMLNKQPEKRDLDGQESKASLQQKIRQLESQTQSRPQVLPIDQLTILPRFRDIFPIKEEVLSAITANMHKAGFDAHHPILVWQENHIVIDGHTRLRAAQLTGLTHVPIAYVSFDSQDAAEQYIFSLQFHRRNLTEADRLGFLIRWLEHLGSKKLETGHKKEITATLLNISPRTAQKYLNIAQNADKELREKVLTSQLSVHQADLLITHAKQSQKMLESGIEEMVHDLLEKSKPQQQTPQQESIQQPPLAADSKPRNATRLKNYFDNLQKQPQNEISMILSYTQELIYGLLECGALEQKDATDLFKKITLMQKQK